MFATGSETRIDLLEAAEAVILERGFTGATVDAIAGRAGVSKGAFFHHFASKAELGRALVERHAEREVERMEALLDRAADMSQDPLVQVLIAIAVLEEEARASGDAPSASLLAAVACQPESFERETRDVAREARTRRRALFAERLEDAVRRHARGGELDPGALAEMFEAMLEGSRILQTMHPENGSTVARQLGQYRSYLELLFSVPADAGTYREG